MSSATSNRSSFLRGDDNGCRRTAVAQLPAKIILKWKACRAEITGASQTPLQSLSQPIPPRRRFNSLDRREDGTIAGIQSFISFRFVSTIIR